MIRVFDDVLPDPEAYRERALRQEFGEVAIGADTFRGIASCPDADLVAALIERVPEARPSLTFFRKSPRGQLEPNYIHSDANEATFTAIYYMRPDPPVGDGTTFWRHGGVERGPWNEEMADKARSGMFWEPWRHVPAQFNRLLVFPADLYHSRAIHENYGAGDSARLIQVVFA